MKAVLWGRPDSRGHYLLRWVTHLKLPGLDHAHTDVEHERYSNIFPATGVALEAVPSTKGYHPALPRRVALPLAAGREESLRLEPALPSIWSALRWGIAKTGV